MDNIKKIIYNVIVTIYEYEESFFKDLEDLDGDNDWIGSCELSSVYLSDEWCLLKVVNEIGMHIEYKVDTEYILNWCSNKV